MTFQTLKTFLMTYLWVPTVSFLVMAPQIVYSKGPGIDGGGGVSIITSSGQLRFWDLAQAENESVSPLSENSMNQIMLAGKRYVTRQAEVIDSNSFFSCGIEKFKKSKNIYLQAMAELPLNLHVALTEVPFPTEPDPNWQIHFKSKTGWVYSLTINNPEILFSNSLEKNKQRPTAAYSVQSTKGLDSKMKTPTLIIQKQIYSALSQRDQCALQVHELLRWMAHDTEYEITWLLTRDWTHAEIEKLTSKIMFDQEIDLSEIPAAPVLKLIAQLFVQKITFENREALEIEISSAEGRASAATAFLLRRMSQNANETVYFAENGIAHISKADPKRLARKFINTNLQQKDTRWIDLCEALPKAVDTNQKCWTN